MKTYKANIKMPNHRPGDRYIEVVIQAKNLMDARAILEGQYGRGCIASGPFETR